VLAIALYGLYFFRYVQVTEGDFRLLKAQTESGNEETLPLVGVDKLLELSIGPAPWVLSDSNERIAGRLRNIERTYPFRSMAIWGWAPGVYVSAGLPPATRDSITQHAITQGPVQQYYRDRFLEDLHANPPDLFIDAVVPSEFANWTSWSADSGYQSFPELHRYIDANYDLVDQVTLAKDAKPVRFFVRRGTAQ
jgi:hypothetical protein